MHSTDDLNDGYMGGDKKNSQFGTCWITNGIENLKIKKESALPEGWKFGRTIKKA